MPDPRIDLKNPWVAGVLAFLIPGAGHFYQGRTFKGLIYSICILGTFAFGMFLGAGQVVYFRWDPLMRTWGYLAQFWVGLPALPALVQSQRTDPAHDALHDLDGPLGAPFRGSLRGDGPAVGELRGEIELEPGDVGARGVFRGTLTSPDRAPQAVELVLSGRYHPSQPTFTIDPEILAGPDRRLAIGVIDVRSGNIPRAHAGSIEGAVPRPFWNWFQAPPGERQLQMLHRRLGKFFELAAVFTWIAGLLNILAIWDAIEGPAYGYGDETEDTEDDSADKPEPAAGPPEPVAAGASAPNGKPGGG